MLRHRRDPTAPVRDSCPRDEQTNTEAVRLEDAETQKRSVRSEEIRPLRLETRVLVMNRLTLKLFDSRMLRHRRDPSAPVRDSCPRDEQTNTEAVRLEDAETQKRSVRSG
ncbi:unnamed protein product [Leuciscus chuanchicus]